MPSLLPKACAYPGCPAIVRTRFCPAHQRQVYQQQDRQRPPSSRRGYGGHWRQIRVAHLRRHPACVVCGEPATEVDHVIPIEAGGTHHDSNLRSHCKRHHSAKTMRQSVATPPKGEGGVKISAALACEPHA